MKKSTIFLILVIALLIVSGCNKKAEDIQTTESAVPDTDNVPPSPPGFEDTAATAQVETLELIRCTDNKIEAMITNNNDMDIEITKDVKIIINGLVVVDPECDKMLLKPGESTTCADITGHYPIRTGKINKVQLNLHDEKIDKDIDCS